MAIFSNIKRKRNLFIFLSIMGPGIITACADNDAGGIATYSIVGAQFGYSMLWMLVLITASLAMVQEMASRMGAVTGKGLSDLIREHFGLRWTIFAIAILLVANVATTIANFAGIAASMEIFGITKYISVPLIGFLLWLFIVRGSYRGVERLFLMLCLLSGTYIISGFMAKPDWGLALHSVVVPQMKFEADYLMVFIATIGTTITPWMQFFLQSSIVDKGINKKKYAYQKWDVIIGAFITDFVAFFIVIACAATLYKHGITIQNAKEAAVALQPFAGHYAEILFAIGLFGASTLGAAILPLSSSYALCEAFGVEQGLNRHFHEAKGFYIIYTSLILSGIIFVLLPNLNLLSVILFSQFINGVLLPFILIFMLILINDKNVMGDYKNSRSYNVIVGGTIGFIILLTVILAYMTIFKLIN